MVPPTQNETFHRYHFTPCNTIILVRWVATDSNHKKDRTHEDISCITAMLVSNGPEKLDFRNFLQQSGNESQIRPDGSSGREEKKKMKSKHLLDLLASFTGIDSPNFSLLFHFFPHLYVKNAPYVVYE